MYLDKDGMSSIADDELCSAREKEGDVVIITGKLNYHDTETSFMRVTQIALKNYVSHCNDQLLYSMSGCVLQTVVSALVAVYSVREMFFSVLWTVSLALSCPLCLVDCLVFFWL